MRAEYREGECFERLTFTGETFYDCDFSDCVFADCTFEDCKLDHSVLTECQFLRCTVTNLKTTMSRAKFTDFENCTLNNIDWMSLQGDGAFADPIESLRDCRLKYNTFTEMNLTKFKFAGSVIQRSMFAKCNLVSADFEKCDLLDTEFFQCDMRKANFKEASGYKVDIFGCKLQDAKFSLPEAVSLLGDLRIKLLRKIYRLKSCPMRIQFAAWRKGSLAAALAAETDITHPAPSLHIIPQRGAFYGAFPKRH